MQQLGDAFRCLAASCHGGIFASCAVKRYLSIVSAAPIGSFREPQGRPLRPPGTALPYRFHSKERRCVVTHPHIRDSSPLPEPSDQTVGPLTGVPTFTPRKTDLQENYLEVDPDNPARLLEYFSDLLRHGNLEPSDAQKDLMNEMQALLDAIEAENFKSPAAFNLPVASVSNETQQGAASSQPQVLCTLSSFLRRIASRNSSQQRPQTTARPAATLTPKIRGLYIWGGVGQGKTMILDAFFDCLPLKKKLRVHFHEFMLDVQKELHRVQQQQPDVEDPLMEVARTIREKAQVLCFDEFQVVHITDAMIMKRLFEGLFSLGAVVVATSNRAPQELYSGGLNRQRFLPFIPLLERFCKVYHIDTKKDYRLAKGGVRFRSLFYAPPRPDDIIFRQLEQAAGGPLGPGEIEVAMGRTLKVPLMRGRFAAFTFAELCATNVGPSDYLALAARFHTISLRRIPDLHKSDQYPNEIRRFISLIDVLYERSVRALFDAEMPVFRLLGMPEAVRLMEEFRQALRAKFARLGEAFKAMSSHCEKPEMFTANEWAAAAYNVLGLTPGTAEALFQLMTNEGSTLLTPARIRSLLFFHFACYDFNMPTTADLFLFSNEAEAKATLEEPAVYALNNKNLDSSDIQDNQFAFIRTVSRIRDMTSLPYLLAHQKTHGLNDLAAMGIHTNSI